VSPLKLSEVTVQDVVEYISYLDSHKAVGVDGTLAKFIKASPLSMAVLMTKLINTVREFCLLPFQIVGNLLFYLFYLSMLYSTSAEGL